MLSSWGFTSFGTPIINVCLMMSCYHFPSYFLRSGMLFRILILSRQVVCIIRWMTFSSYVVFCFSDSSESSKNYSGSLGSTGSKLVKVNIDATVLEGMRGGGGIFKTSCGFIIRCCTIPIRDM